MSALAFAAQILGILPALLQAGVEITGFIQKYRERIDEMATTGRDPTPDEWDELNAEIRRLRGDLHEGEGG